MAGEVAYRMLPATTKDCPKGSTCRTVCSIFAPAKPETERSHNYFVKNLDLLLKVTGTEDFALMQQIQANLDSGALAELVYGRNEPPLIHYHRELNNLLAAST